MQSDPQTGPQRFLAALSAAATQRMRTWQTQARQLPAPDYVTWRCGDAVAGLLSPSRADWLAQQLPDCQMQERHLVWHAGTLPRPQRSQILQDVLERANARGLLSGWRGERFSFWHSDCLNPDPQASALLDVERSGFRFLGMLSHAVHVNGFLPDGRLWIARRSLTKATDPGMLDNVTAGGLPAGETVMQCLQRELQEEAGLADLQGVAVAAAGAVRTSRLEKEGWHDEALHLFNLTLPYAWEPRNADGEVSEFMCLQPLEAFQRMEAGEMTIDAMQSLIHGLFAAP